MALKLRPRLLPIVVVAAIVLLGIKLGDLLAHGGLDVANSALAEAAGPPAASPSGSPEGDKPAPAPEKSAAPAQAPAAPSAAPAGPIKDPESLSPSELEVLQQLSERRAALDRRAGALDQREVLLQAAEKRIDEKIAKLAELQKSIDAVVQKQNAEDDARIQSLVKIYEAMKPRDAAQIFEQLEMPVLLAVISRMKELKTAPILAAMEPAKAKAITTALAVRRNQTAARPAPDAASAN